MKKATLVLVIMVAAISAFAQGNRGQTGEMGNRLDAEFVESDGLLVTAVLEDGPAAAAGIQRGDILLSIDGEDLVTGQDLYEALDGKRGGEPVEFRVRRGDSELDVRVTLEDRVNRPALGLSFHPGARGRGFGDMATPRPFGLDIDGVMIVRVTDDSAADAAGIEAGMIIIEIDGEDVSDPQEVVDLISAKDAGDRVTLTVVNLRDVAPGDGEPEARTINARLGEDEDGDAVLGVQLGRWMRRAFDGPRLRGPESDVKRAPDAL
jgi:S1-C subfamily serine protease